MRGFDKDLAGAEKRSTSTWCNAALKGNMAATTPAYQGRARRR
jgi:hypothetical protein